MTRVHVPFGEDVRGLGVVNGIDLDQHHGMVWQQVRSMAWRTHNLHVTHQDLAQVGYMGLIEAAKRFDHARGLKFSTYATRYIWGFIMRELSLARWAPDYVQDRHVKAGTWSELREQAPVSQLRRDEEIAALNAESAFVSNESEAEQRAALERTMRDLFRPLTPRLRVVARMRFVEEQTLDAIGAHLGISRERVRQLETEARALIAEAQKPEAKRRIITEEASWRPELAVVPRTRRRKLTPEERGRLGGLRAAERMTPEQRRERARSGAHARWRNRRARELTAA